MHPVLSRRRFEEDIAGITPELCAERQWEVFQCVFLVFDVGFTAPDGARLRTRFLCDDWNDRPPAIELSSPPTSGAGTDDHEGCDP